MTETSSYPSDRSPADWDEAPCGLLRVDGRLRITDANPQFFAMTGRMHSGIGAGIALTDVLAPAARILFESQLAPMLRLNGLIDEVLLEVSRPDGQRVPVLLNARWIDNTETALIALMPVPDRLRYEQQLRQARIEADSAVQQSNAARHRLELLALANQALAGSVDVDTALSSLAGVLVRETADWCVIYSIDTAPPHLPTQWAAAHSDPQRFAVLQRFASLMPAASRPKSAFKRVLSGGKAVLRSDLTIADLQAPTPSDEVAALFPELDIASALVVPSVGQAAQQTAVIVLGRSKRRPAFTDTDLNDLTDLAARTRIAIDNLKLHAREHIVAVGLQQAMLTAPPTHAGVEIETRYVPGVNGNEVGGDWYDAFVQPDGTLVVVIGDVMGHDITAAGAMGQLRGVIRTIGYAAPGTAADILSNADRTATGLHVSVYATAIVARLLPCISRAGSWTLEWSNAGHPPPVVLRKDESFDVLVHRNDVLLGVAPASPRHNNTIDLDVGDTVLLYSDGLVERRDQPFDESVAELGATLAKASAVSLSEICTGAVALRPASSSDDVAIIALRIVSGP
ncbi:MAG: SpoIIE family protein phosphatase [Actinomycetota bacterium]|nr:SpoIIE family protein phosphatase [Actinomycetota bacterium]